MTKRALLVGSSFSAAPIFFALRRRGLHITVCGNVANDPCHQYADASCYIDYSDRDALLDYLRGQSFDYLIPSCNDFSYVSCAWAARELRFAGFDDWDTSEMLHTKHLFRHFCVSNSIPAPRHVAYREGMETELTSLPYPLLIKPADSFSGRGVTKLDTDAGLLEALSGAKVSSRTGNVVVEEFKEGSLHSHSAFVQDGAIFWDGFVDEYCTVYPYQVNCSNSPSHLSDVVRQTVRAAMSRLIKAASLVDGLLHTQFLVQGDDVWIIEVMRRGPGDLYGLLLEHSTGINYNDLYVAKFLGERYSLSATHGRSVKYIGRHTASVERSTVAAGFSLSATLNVISIIPLKVSGERLDPAPFDKIAIFFAEFSDAESMLACVPKFADLTEIESLEKKHVGH